MAQAKFSWKQTLFTLHLWLGLPSGIIVSILCVTGFLLALQVPLDRWANRDLLERPVGGSARSAESLMADVLKIEQRRFTALEVPTDPGAPWVLKEGRRATFLDPYSGELLGPKLALAEDFFRGCFRLHRWLLLDTAVGRPITGAATVIFIFTLLSGLLLWFYKTGKNMARGLRLKRGSSWKRKNYDLHLALGMYTALPLLVMAVSGLFWSYRDGFLNVTYRALDGSAPPPAVAREKGEPPLNHALPLDLLLEKAEQEWAYPGVVNISFPPAGADRVTVSKTRPAGFGSFPTRDEMVLGLPDGAVLELRPFSEKTRAEKLLSQIKGIHMGTFWGGSSLLLYLLVSLLGATLPITGTVMWANRMLSKRRSLRLLVERDRHPDSGR